MGWRSGAAFKVTLRTGKPWQQTIDVVTVAAGAPESALGGAGRAAGRGTKKKKKKVVFFFLQGTTEVSVINVTRLRTMN